MPFVSPLAPHDQRPTRSVAGTSEPPPVAPGGRSPAAEPGTDHPEEGTHDQLDAELWRRLAAPDGSLADPDHLWRVGDGAWTPAGGTDRDAPRDTNGGAARAAGSGTGTGAGRDALGQAAVGREVGEVRAVESKVVMD